MKEKKTNELIDEILELYEQGIPVYKAIDVVKKRRNKNRDYKA